MRVRSTQFEHLPGLLTELDPYRPQWEREVGSIANNPSSDEEQRTRGSLALARRDNNSRPSSSSRTQNMERP